MDNSGSSGGVVIENRAFCKIMMHCAKYTCSSLNGVLLARRDEMRNGRPARVCDVVPLFHLSPGLTPMLEVALPLIEKEVENSGLVLAGFYHAHDNIEDTSLDVFTRRIADKMVDNQPGAIILTVDSSQLSSDMTGARYGLILRQHVDGVWKTTNSCDNNDDIVDSSSLSSAAMLRIGDSDSASSRRCAALLIKKRLFRDLVDFDNHLDDLTQDYLNVQINMKIDSCLSQAN